MLPMTPPALRSGSGSVHMVPTSDQFLVRFGDTCMLLREPQARSIGNMLAHMLVCPFGDRYLENGMRLVSPGGERRLALTRASATELRDLLNDTLLLLDATTTVSAIMANEKDNLGDPSEEST